MVNLPKQLQDCKIFPIIKDAKKPAVAAWQKVASNDPAQIAAWERQYPECNWGIPMGLNGFLGYDIDRAGFDWWQRLQDENQIVRKAVQETFRVRTPKGGYHYYFKGEGHSGASRIAGGIDTRGGIIQPDGSVAHSGYLVMPGSHTEEGSGCVKGDYVVEHDAEILGLPQYLKDIIPTKHVGEVKGLSKNPDFDQPRNVEWATNILKGYVEKDSVAIEGKGGDTLTIATATAVLSKAISPQKCYDLMQEYWNPHCVPPWEEWELELKIRNAFNSGRNTKTGAEGFLSNTDAFAGFKNEVPAEDAQPEKQRVRLQWLHDYADNVSDPTWLIPNVLPAEGIGVFYGDTGTFKSFIALDMSLCLAYGIPGQWRAPPVKHDVLFITGEAPKGTARLRWPAWMEYHSIKSRTDHRLIFRDIVPLYTDKESWANLKTELAEMGAKPSLIVIDTLARLIPGMDEDKPGDATIVTTFLENLARYYECFVLYVHHTGKDISRGARGSSAWIQNPDMGASLKKTENGTQLKFHKQKDIDTTDSILYFEKVQVGSSIFLKKTEQAPEIAVEKKNGSRYAWASVEEVTKVLVALGGETSSSMLAQEIAGHHGLDAGMVQRKLMNNDDLAWLRPTDGKWAIPKKMEYDL